MSSDKQDIIYNTYFDRGGFGSKARTLQEARKKDKTITIEDINQFFSKNVEQKRKTAGQNSFVAPNAYYEFQIDLFFINDIPNQKFRVGMICIDIFSKYMNAVPISSKQPPDILAGVMENIKKMDGKPKLIYIDDEGSFNNKSVIDYLKEENIELHRTRWHPAFAERAIRTLKDMLYKRVENDEKKGKENIQWGDYLHEILLTYNNAMKHSSHGMEPIEARKPKNQLAVKLKLSMNAKKNRVYPELEIGDTVKILRKRKPNEKERVGNWTQNRFTIEKIDKKKLGQSYYYVEGNDRPYFKARSVKGIRTIQGKTI